MINHLVPSSLISKFHGCKKNCDYVDMLDDLIRDQERIQQRLLSEGSVLTLKKALDASLALESAIKQSNFQNCSNNIDVFKLHPKKSIACFCCAGNHSTSI